MMNGAPAMTDKLPDDMPDNMSDDLDNGGHFKRVAFFALTGVGATFTAAILIGFFTKHIELGGGALRPLEWAIVLGFAAMLLLCGALFLKQAPAFFGTSADSNRLEKLNRRIMTGALLLGVIIGMVMTISGQGAGEASPFSSGPLPPLTALILAGVTAIFMPLISYYWHKNATDELEEAAYRDGAMWACYFYWTVSSTWWLLWRGGMAQPVNGVLIFFGTIFVSLTVWMWKKYR